MVDIRSDHFSDGAIPVQSVVVWHRQSRGLKGNRKACLYACFDAQIYYKPNHTRSWLLLGESFVSSIFASVLLLTKTRFGSGTNSGASFLQHKISFLENLEKVIQNNKIYASKWVLETPIKKITWSKILSSVILFG